MRRFRGGCCMYYTADAVYISYTDIREYETHYGTLGRHKLS